MFTLPAADPTLSTSTSPASPTRPSRLRGLSYLREYTRDHLHSHSNHSTSHSTRPSLSRAQSSPPAQVEDPTSGSSTTVSTPFPDLEHPTTSPGATSGWLPTGSGRSGLSRITSQIRSPNTAEAPSLPASISTTATSTVSMTRNRAETATPTMGAARTTTMTNGSADAAQNGERQLPSIRFIPHQDPRAQRPSLIFPAISRTLPSEDSVIRVGRYSERDANPEIPANTPSAAPVGFKSKVVSRRHCELYCQNQQWFIKDVKSSSGTFLNHIRLSQPGQESRPFPVKDGDVVQLGIDFRGGEEMIFRCVKIRIECNRSWQKQLNDFNKSTHKQLRKFAKTSKKRDSETASVQSTECSICLMSVAPCQALFVAPCSHVWHYKCIRPMLESGSYPNFLCPNCRAVADLEADVDEVEDDDWDDDVSDIVAGAKQTADKKANGEQTNQSTPKAGLQPTTSAGVDAALSDDELNAAMEGVSLSRGATPAPFSMSAENVAMNGDAQAEAAAEAPSSATSAPLPIGSPGSGASVPMTPSIRQQAALMTPETVSGSENPMTPRNDAGPFVFDGSAGRSRAGEPETRDGAQ